MEDQSMNQAEQPLSVGQWMLNIFLLAIPLVGIIMLFIWAFGGNEPQTKANWAKAMLVWYAIGIVMLILFYGALLALFLGSGGMSGF